MPTTRRQLRQRARSPNVTKSSRRSTSLTKVEDTSSSSASEDERGVDEMTTEDELGVVNFPPVATSKKVPRHLEDPTPGNIQEEGFIDAFYQPRSFSGLMTLVALIVYVTLYDEKKYLGEGNRVKSGILLAAAAFLLYCLIQLRDGHLIRPHPAVWRVVHGTGLLYFLLLVFLLCQNLEGIHHFLQLFDPRVGLETKEHSYGDDCRLFIPNSTDPFANIKGQFFDRFTVAHFLGWMLKALILRDWGLMWVASVLFEVLEVTFQHMYPNFNECWWDHLILDVFGCNFAGMYIGMKLVDYLGTHQFDWTGQRMELIPGRLGKMKRVVLQFSPYSFQMYRWQVFSSWRRLAIGVSVLSILLLGELNGFFIKSTFNIPIDSDINLYRLTFWLFITYMAVFEFYRFAEGKSRRVGVNSWLAGSLVCLETLLVVKHSYQQQMFKRHEIFPASYISKGWLATLVCIFLTAVTKATRKAYFAASGAEEVYNVKGYRSPKRPRKAEQELKDMLLYAKFLDGLFQIMTFALPIPLLIVFALDCFRTASTHPPPKPGVDAGW